MTKSMSRGCDNGVLARICVASMGSRRGQGQWEAEGGRRHRREAEGGGGDRNHKGRRGREEGGADGKQKGMAPMGTERRRRR
ncbi:hypothetical protein GUJ93_ZPchr0003g17643 [Zizania palustris]|uniref:Uncharacterized protein n=1 Tax=Zizania palustris TaxID=103762 RepID=A0A8J5SKS9_ZIZPA|nr:hypothetical protein GUJ93_ZPchr0003g17643 [Zizania palustris]